MQFDSKLPLKGKKILDCSTLLPGPMIGKLLAEKGAHVIKIENPDKPDPARIIGEFYLDLNEKKELLWLNLLNANDQMKFQELVKSSDALIEGFRPQAKKKLKLEENFLHTLNPKLCILSLVGDTKLNDQAGHDINFQAATGMLSLYNEMPPLPLADLFAAYWGAFSLAAQLDSVSLGAKGAKIVVSLSEVLTHLQSGFYREFKKTRELPLPGNTLFSGKFPCYQMYFTQDGKKIAVGAVEEKFWISFCQVLGLNELVQEGYASDEKAFEVKKKVQEKLNSKPWSYWKSLFIQANCCVNEVLNYKDLL
ncbi:MAG: CoA transferase [Bdellovibrio sp.]|nr:CoA transferase [Bdellovibrio sp.]